MKFRRYSIKSKESKRFLIEIAKRFNFELETFFSFKSKVEVVETNIGKIYLVEGKPVFFQLQNSLIPTLLFDNFSSTLPKVVVDMGAVPYVCKGANVMVPGIVRINGEFEKGDLVLIVDENHEKSLALGESIYSSNEINVMKKGIVIKNLHFVSDKIWDISKTLFEKL